MCGTADPSALANDEVIDKIREHQGHSQNVSGGAIAVIHPTQRRAYGNGVDLPGQHPVAWKVLMVPDTKTGLLSFAVLDKEGQESVSGNILEYHDVVVHRDGDLALSGDKLHNVMSKFPAAGNVSSKSSKPGELEIKTAAPTKPLSLEVGLPDNRGIIGRRVSVINPTGILWGEEVIGWH